MKTTAQEKTVLEQDAYGNATTYSFSENTWLVTLEQNGAEILMTPREIKTLLRLLGENEYLVKRLGWMT